MDASGAVNDFRLSDFLQTQFDKDILIQSQTSFEAYRINFRAVVQPQEQLIVNAMLARFDNPSPVLTSLLTPSQLTKAKADFLVALQAGALFTFWVMLACGGTPLYIPAKRLTRSVALNALCPLVLLFSASTTSNGVLFSSRVPRAR